MESFRALIHEAPRGGAFVEVPPEVVAALGGRGRIPVRATFDGNAYRGSIVSMGGGRILGVRKDIRTGIGKAPGDVVAVTVEVDEGERSVTVPGDVDAALGEAGLRDAFASLSYSRRREYVSWVEAARQPATRARRISQMVDRIRG